MTNGQAADDIRDFLSYALAVAVAQEKLGKDLARRERELGAFTEARAEVVRARENAYWEAGRWRRWARAAHALARMAEGPSQQ